MKIFRLLFLCLFISITPVTGHAQVTKGVSKVLKGVLKKGGRETVETAAEKGGKEAGKRAARKGGAAAARKTTKEIAGESAEQAIRRHAEHSLTKQNFGKSAVRVRKVGASSEAELGSMLRSGFGRNAAKGVGRATAREMRHVGADASQELTERALKNSFGTAESKAALKRTGNNNLKKTSREAGARKSAIRAGKTFTGREALKLLDDSPELMKRIMKLEAEKGPLFNLDNLVVKKSGKHRIVEFAGTNSRIEIKGNQIFAKGGSTTSNGAMNEFLNNPLPNTTYHVDDYLKYATDAQGKTIYEECHSSELVKKVSRTSLPSENKTRLVQAKGGKQGVHDSGHIQQFSTGGLNEDINLLPMRSSAQRGGEWAKFEKAERDAIHAGHDVRNRKWITYNPDGSYTIKVEQIITDKTTGKVSKKTKTFNNLFSPKD